MPEATSDFSSGRPGAGAARPGASGSGWTGPLLAGLGLTGLVLLCFPAVAWYLHLRHGENGLIAAAAAAALCWVGSLFALAVHAVCRSPRRAMAGALGAMLVRSTFVFGTMIVLTAASPTLRGSGFAPAVVFYFLVTLAAETALVLWTVRPGESATGEVHSERVQTNETK